MEVDHPSVERLATIKIVEKGYGEVLNHPSNIPGRNIEDLVAKFVNPSWVCMLHRVSHERACSGRAVNPMRGALDEDQFKAGLRLPLKGM